LAFSKANYGNETNLPSQKIEGYIYYCTNTGNVFFDFIDVDGLPARVQINSNKANRLRYYEDNTEKELLPTDIARKDDVDTKVSISQGVSNKGKILMVGEDGMVSPSASSSVSGILRWGDVNGVNGLPSSVVYCWGDLCGA